MGAARNWIIRKAKTGQVIGRGTRYEALPPKLAVKHGMPHRNLELSSQTSRAHGQSFDRPDHNWHVDFVVVCHVMSGFFTSLHCIPVS